MEKVLAELKDVKELDALWRLAVDYCLRAGFECATYQLFQRGQEGDPVAVLSHGVPEEFIGSYVDLGMGRTDPVIRYAFSSRRPFNIDDLPQLMTLSREEKKVLDRIGQYGGVNVMLMPLFGSEAINGIMGVSGFTKYPNISDYNWDQIHAAVQAIHMHAVSLIPVTRMIAPNPLSERETEILKWVANGKSNSVISEILGISTGTVDTYLRRVFQKLEVADRTMAAVKGISLGLIGVF